MTDTPPGDPSIQDGNSPPTSDATPPAQADTGGDVTPSGGEPTDVLAQFRDAGGNLDGDRLANELKRKSDLETLYGRQSNELGELRQTKSQYDAFLAAEYVEDPDNPGEPIHRSVLDARKAAPAQPGDGNLSEEEIAERLRDLRDEDELAYHRLMLDTAKREVLAELGQRDAVYTSPATQKILNEHPDVRPRAEQIANEEGIPLDRAFKLAVGEKMIEAAGGATPSAPTPSVNLGNLLTRGRTFMGPQGKPPEEKPKSNLTDAQIARIKQMYGPDADLSQFEPYADKE
jgi:hypothetical protein